MVSNQRTAASRGCLSGRKRSFACESIWLRDAEIAMLDVSVSCRYRLVRRIRALSGTSGPQVPEARAGGRVSSTTSPTQGRSQIQQNGKQSWRSSWRMIKGRVENRTILDPNATLFWRMSITRKKGLIGLAVLCVTIPVMLIAQPAEKKTLVGVWEVKISAGGVPPPPLLSIASFGGDGSFTTAGNTKFPQGLGSDQRGPGYGRWAQTGDREFKLTV